MPDFPNLTADRLYRINDALTALTGEMGASLDDTALNDLTFHVAKVIDAALDPVTVFLRAGGYHSIEAWAADSDYRYGVDIEGQYGTITGSGEWYRVDDTGPDAAIVDIEEALHDAMEAAALDDAPAPPPSIEFPLDAVVEAVTRQGIPAYVEMTGGGVATIYAGEREEVIVDGLRYMEHPIAAGPGWFEGPNYTLGTATTDDFYIGRNNDDSQDGGYLTFADVLESGSDPITVAARLIVEAITKHKSKGT